MSRIYVSSPITFYVNNVTGNDGNDGLSSGSPWKTIQHAVNILQAGYDFAAQPTIQLATTGVVYLESVTLGRYLGSLGYTPTGYTYPKIIGDSNNRANVTVQAPGTDSTFVSVNGDPWIIDSLTVVSFGAYGVESDAHAHLLLNNLNFGYCGLGHMTAIYGGFIETLAGAYVISGSAPYHIDCAMRGEYVSQGNPVSFLGVTFFYFARGLSEALIAAGQMNCAGPYASDHPGRVSNDGTATMLPTGSGGWP
jgi:hypothetical protein